MNFFFYYKKRDMSKKQGEKWCFPPESSNVDTYDSMVFGVGCVYKKLSFLVSFSQLVCLL